MYEVLWISIHTETNEKLVLYKALYDIWELEKEFLEKNITFVRPFSMFFENIELDWNILPRFDYIWE